MFNNRDMMAGYQEVLNGTGKAKKATPEHRNGTSLLKEEFNAYRKHILKENVEITDVAHDEEVENPVVTALAAELERICSCKVCKDGEENAEACDWVAAAKELLTKFDCVIKPEENDGENGGEGKEDKD